MAIGPVAYCTCWKGADSDMRTHANLMFLVRTQSIMEVIFKCGTVEHDDRCLNIYLQDAWSKSALSSSLHCSNPVTLTASQEGAWRSQTNKWNLQGCWDWNFLTTLWLVYLHAAPLDGSQWICQYTILSQLFDAISWWIQGWFNIYIIYA